MKSKIIKQIIYNLIINLMIVNRWWKILFKKRNKKINNKNKLIKIIYKKINKKNKLIKILYKKINKKNKLIKILYKKINKKN
jgi:hypothetical protein